MSKSLQGLSSFLRAQASTTDSADAAGTLRNWAAGIEDADPDKFREAIRAAAIRAGLLHSDAPMTDEQLLTLLQNVADAAYYARVCHS